MAEETDGRLMDVGDIIESPRGTFVVTGVQYQETDGERHSFTYLIKNPADLISEEEQDNGGE